MYGDGVVYIIGALFADDIVICCPGGGSGRFGSDDGIWSLSSCFNVLEIKKKLNSIRIFGSEVKF